MSEQEKTDALLRQAMSGEPPPTLSSGFDARLARRLRPRRLTPTGRAVLAGYTVVALSVAIWAMRLQAIDWSLIGAAVAVPLVITATIYRRHVRPAL